MRQFGPSMEDVMARRDEARELLAMVDDSGEMEREAREALEAAESALVAAAKALSEARRRCAPRFAQEVTRQMGRLEMSGARLIVGVEPLPFAKIASGGEVSRVMLSINLALGAHDDVETLVFDEIDAGVGGSTARAIAEVLADLARTHQVIVVTHLAQVAVRAQRQYVVSKGTSARDGRLETRLSLAEGEERVAEVVRMLSGDEGEQSMAHARSLLAEASRAGRA